MVADVMGIDKNRLVFDLSKPNGVYRKGIDNSRFIALSGYRYTPFREGLERTVQWFVSTSQTDPEGIRLGSKM